MNKGLKIQLSKLKHHLLKYKVINSNITKFYNKNYEKELKQLLATINECDNVDIDNDIPVNDIRFSRN
jgi:dihydroorotate dehydrogenase